MKIRRRRDIMILGARCQMIEELSRFKDFGRKERRGYVCYSLIL